MKQIVVMFFVSAVLYPIGGEDLFKKQGPGRSILAKIWIQYIGMRA
jgi:hypothetical protein